MPCYKPLRAFWTGGFTDKNKKQLIITSERCKSMSYSFARKKTNNIKLDALDSKGNPIWTANNGEMFLKDSMLIGCGSCIGCRLEYARQWAVRCMKECEQYSNNYFVTLTYDDDHLPKNRSLDKQAISKFMKAFRQLCKRKYGVDNIRFFGCGEYGESSARPHYHLILMNCPAIQKTFYKATSLKHKYYDSEDIRRCWQYGFNVVAKAEFDSCSYVARYVTKKFKGNESKIYEEHGLLPPFVLMSRRPGIGEKYFNDKGHTIYETDEIYYTHNQKILKSTPPRYFDKLAERKGFDTNSIRDARLFKASNSQLNLQEKLQLDQYALLERQEEQKIAQITSLKRKMC